MAALARDPATRRFVSFLAVGGLNTAFGYGAFALLILVGARAGTALAGATIVGVLFNFNTVGRLVFRSRDPGLLPRFLAVYAVQFAINLLALRALGRAGLSPLLAQLALVLPLALLSFVAMRRFVFRATPRP